MRRHFICAIYKVKHENVSLCNWEKIVVSASKCTKNLLEAGFCPDPLGELTAIPRPLAGFRCNARGGKRERRRWLFNFNIDVIYTFRDSVNKCELREIARDYQFSSRVHSVQPYSPHEHCQTGPEGPGTRNPGINFFYQRWNRRTVATVRTVTQIVLDNFRDIIGSKVRSNFRRCSRNLNSVWARHWQSK